MKLIRRTSLLLAAVLLLSAALPLMAMAETRMRVTSNMLRLRAGPDTIYSVRGWYKKGTVVTVLNTKKSAKWYYVRTSDGRTGWMSKKFLVKASTPVKKAEEPATGVAQATKNVRLRKGPGTGYDTITVVRNKKLVRIVGKSGSWLKVRYNGKTGFVYGPLFKIKSTE